MSVSPSFPHGAPTLAEVLIERTFAKPTNPFVDGEFIDALDQAGESPPVTVAITKAPTTSGSAGADAGSTPAEHARPAAADASAPTGDAPAHTIDVRA